jgi:hypothetical protein
MGIVIPRSVHAQLRERFIFNFRLRPDALAARLPVPWLQPQVINGWSVASFCILGLRRVMVAPLPGFLGFTTVSCAYRCGVIDHSGSAPEASVWIVDRNTDLPLIARLAPFLFLDTIPVMRLAIDREPQETGIQVAYLDRQRMFAAKVRPAAAGAELNSEVFGSTAEFADFIKKGVSSYTPSIFGDALARVDLVKEDADYRPMDAVIEFDWLERVWLDADLEFDSAVRATGGGYRWTYRGLVSSLGPEAAAVAGSAARGIAY